MNDDEYRKEMVRIETYRRQIISIETSLTTLCKELHMILNKLEDEIQPIEDADKYIRE